ncbi:AAA family ATPase [Pedobacter sp. D749]|uniref:AAA family ATPase n=1 Tax=Pedobacter sp. D749 TaxID=2856523 RepID=UPI001C56213F|nr:AAA family ATPase [Pedobacter sp. D749]QXU44129.1 AAA family ATPase [Pedobacter sp. D749]
MNTEQIPSAAIAVVETLESDVKKFADNLPYWAKYLAEKLLASNVVNDADIETAYNFLLDELKLTDEIDKPEIFIAGAGASATAYASDLVFYTLENISGVNALLENQSINFSKHLTVIYGANGTGKSGYTRLLKDVFYSKAKEAILPNVHLESGHKPIDAKFGFLVGATLKSWQYQHKDQPEFKQFSVFDGKSVVGQLENRNEFEFRPGGLSFFGEYTSILSKVEEQLNEAIRKKKTENQFGLWFDEPSEIKTFVENLSYATKAEQLDNYVPYVAADLAERQRLQKEYDELLLASQNKDKEIKNLENLKKQLVENKLAIEKINKLFSMAALQRISELITDYNTKAAFAKAEGIENFKTDKLEQIGSEEWKRFILAANDFALKQQGTHEHIYPNGSDHCLLCHQPLTQEAATLITRYWGFIKSVAEENANKALESLNAAKGFYEQLDVELFPTENTLTNYLSEKYAENLTSWKEQLAAQSKLALEIVKDIAAKTATERKELATDATFHLTIDSTLDEVIKSLADEEQGKKLEELKKEKTFLEHKEKYNLHFDKIKGFVDDLVWVRKAQKANFAKRQVTDTEKNLSAKYFNQKYVDTFNEECEKLNGKFGIEVSHTGSAGKSYRQLRLKGKSPNAILSEGEQKVIAIADFLSEMKLSEINRGIVFDDPVTSLDNDRKKQIAERLAEYAFEKQVIIFTHDIVFFYHVKNFSKKHLATIKDSFIHHSIERDQLFCGKVVANSSPASEGQYKDASKAEQWLAKSKTSSGTERTDYAKFGCSALRSSYEALSIFIVLGGTVQRFDPQIRMGRLKDIKYDKLLVEQIVEKHGEISDLIEGHLPSDEFAVVATPELLAQHIADYKTLKQQIKDL